MDPFELICNLGGWIFTAYMMVSAFVRIVIMVEQKKECRPNRPTGQGPKSL